MTMSPCDTCALRENSVTWDEPYNRLRAMICALAGIPFLCHHGYDWETAHISIMNRRFVTVGVPDQRELRLCAGWQRQVAIFKEHGQFDVSKETRREQKYWGSYALQLVEVFANEQSSEQQKETCRRELQCVITMLAQQPAGEEVAIA